MLSVCPSEKGCSMCLELRRGKDCVSEWSWMNVLSERGKCMCEHGSSLFKNGSSLCKNGSSLCENGSRLCVLSENWSSL